MARPRARELTERELDVMHVFWSCGESTVGEVRDELAASGCDLAHTTVGTLTRILREKGFLERTNAERPFRHRPLRSFDEVSGSVLGHLVERFFQGSREQVLVRLFEKRKLSKKERALLKLILRERRR